MVKAAAEEPAATASGFLFYKIPTPQPVCTGLGLNISTYPNYSRDDCGFANFTLSGTATAVVVRLFAAGASTPFITLPADPGTETPGDYQVTL